ncbi:MAG: three-Cys-motif partner protein TcmP [Blastocatellia bacterium]
MEMPEFLETVEPVTKFAHLNYPVWTENKARFIEQYLYRFVMVTRHGTYIDAFAGPQKPDKPEMWSAKLVLDSEPPWLRHFHLFEVKEEKVKALENLKKSQPTLDSRGHKINRTIEIHPGDSNQNIPKLLASNCIRQKEAAFCLLDQRTFECHWSTVEALAEYKKSGHKIELFYFLAISWLRRALTALKDTDRLRDWWGRDDWAKLRDMKSNEIRDEFVMRIQTELDYKYVHPWPILRRQRGGGIMYYMIHASDHPEAPKLMRRAYVNTVRPREQAEQVGLWELFEKSRA